MKFFNWRFSVLLIAMIMFWIAPFILPTISEGVRISFFVGFGLMVVFSTAYFSNVDELSQDVDESPDQIHWSSFIWLMLLGFATIFYFKLWLSLFLFVLSIATMMWANVVKIAEIYDKKERYRRDPHGR